MEELIAWLVGDGRGNKDLHPVAQVFAEIFHGLKSCLALVVVLATTFVCTLSFVWFFLPAFVQELFTFIREVLGILPR
jgi:hypothetical protein